MATASGIRISPEHRTETWDRRLALALPLLPLPAVLNRRPAGARLICPGAQPHEQRVVHCRRIDIVVRNQDLHLRHQRLGRSAWGAVSCGHQSPHTRHGQQWDACTKPCVRGPARLRAAVQPHAPAQGDEAADGVAERRIVQVVQEHARRACARGAPCASFAVCLRSRMFTQVCQHPSKRVFSMA